MATTNVNRDNLKATGSASGKERRLSQTFTYADGSTGRSARADWSKLTFGILGRQKDADGKAIAVETVEVLRDEFERIHSPEIMACLAIHGYKQKVCDGFADAKSANTPDDPIRGKADYVLEVLTGNMEDLAEGVWVAEREGGGGSRIKVLLEAITRAWVEAKGADAATDEWLAAQRARLTDAKSGEQNRKNAMAHPAVKKHFTAIEAERAAERAAKALAAAKASDAPADMDAFATE